MRFDRTVSVGDMKEKVIEKLSRCCGRRMTKLFYKFPISSNLITFIKMELIDDDDVEIMIALYCPLGTVNIEH